MQGNPPVAPPYSSASTRSAGSMGDQCGDAVGVAQVMYVLRQEIASLRDEVRTMRESMTHSTSLGGRSGSEPTQTPVTPGVKESHIDNGGPEECMEDWRRGVDDEEEQRWRRAWFVGGRWFTTGMNGGTLVWCKREDELRWAHVSGPTDPFGAQIRGQNVLRTLPNCAAAFAVGMMSGGGPRYPIGDKWPHVLERWGVGRRMKGGVCDQWRIGSTMCELARSPAMRGGVASQQTGGSVTGCRIIRIDGCND